MEDIEETAPEFHLFRVEGKRRYPNGIYGSRGEAKNAAENVKRYHGEGTVCVIEGPEDDLNPAEPGAGDTEPVQDTPRRRRGAVQDKSGAVTGVTMGPP